MHAMSVRFISSLNPEALHQIFRAVASPRLLASSISSFECAKPSDSARYCSKHHMHIAVMRGQHRRVCYITQTTQNSTSSSSSSCGRACEELRIQANVTQRQQFSLCVLSACFSGRFFFHPLTTLLLIACDGDGGGKI